MQSRPGNSKTGQALILLISAFLFALIPPLTFVPVVFSLASLLELIFPHLLSGPYEGILMTCILVLSLCLGAGAASFPSVCIIRRHLIPTAPLWDMRYLLIGSRNVISAAPLFALYFIYLGERYAAETRLFVFTALFTGAAVTLFLSTLILHYFQLNRWQKNLDRNSA